MAASMFGRGAKLVKAITGMRFGRLTIVEVLPVTDRNQRPCRCKCDCGNETVATFNSIQQGKKRSCGCLRLETVRTNRLIHGMCGSTEWYSWNSMLSRCYNPRQTRYQDWGGRGITVCDRWRDSFANFYEDLGPKPTPDHQIERRDNDGHYCPENCYWATPSEQAVNRRSTMLITIDGETKCLKHWCREYGVPYVRTYKRIVYRGYDPVTALTLPCLNSAK